mgnify:CR=1 FL=1
MRITLLIILLFYSISQKVHSQSAQDVWVDSIYQKLTLDEKIGQLFMIRAYAKDDQSEIKKNIEIIEKYNVGGICFFQGTPQKMALLNNKYQQISKTPLLISIDGEWGLGMRYPDSSISFPRALTLGAIQDNNLIYQMGRKIAEHCKRIGIHLNFAPVVDVNNNPKNPVINNRSFGEDRYNVAAKSYAYMKGMQDEGVMACAKHFPGHGDTDVDSHLDLPVINHSRARLDSVELMPFRSMIQQGIGSIMVAHLHIPVLDNRKNRPTTLSKNAITSVLRNELAFNGLIITDAMEMKGVTKHFKPGEADKEAFLAGADILLLPEDIKDGVNEIKKAIEEKTISEERLEASVKRILRAKYIHGLANWENINIEGIDKDINDGESLALIEELIENAITVAKDDPNLLPIQKLEGSKFASISIGTDQQTPFQNRISDYVKCKHISMSKGASPSIKKDILKQLKGYDYVLVGMHDMSKYASKNYGIELKDISFLKELSKEHKVIICLFGSPYALKYFETFPSVVVSYEDDNIFQDLTVQAIFGANDIKGRLPVTSSKQYQYGNGAYKSSIGRLGYSVPERVGMDSETLAGIDQIVEEMIKEKAAPGCQVFVAKNNKVVFDKAYGYFTYDKKHQVQKDDIYDVASVTKVCASTVSLMKLYDEKKFDINARVDRYIAEADTCNKGDLNIKRVLAHHAQLVGWIPFYTSTVSDSRKNPKPLDKYYSSKRTDGYTIPVADNLFLRTDYRDTMWSKIYASDLRTEKGYRYSDLAFYFMYRAIQNITGRPFQEYVDSEFYAPMGLSNTGYLPLEKHLKKNIAPSENDMYFRKQVIQGHVHDMGAAMLGGVCGHAGLFSTAKEIGTIFQMLINGGYYGGKQYIKPETIRLFTTRYPESTRRGIGFDMKELDPNKSLNMSELASDQTFGHLGFTGIAAFADPVHDLVYVFVSNRTFPSMTNYKFGRNEYRPRVQSQIYQAMGIDIAIP